MSEHLNFEEIFTKGEIQDICRLSILHRKLTYKNNADSGLDEDEYEEYEQIKNDLSTILPIES